MKVLDDSMNGFDDQVNDKIKAAKNCIKKDINDDFKEIIND